LSKAGSHLVQAGIELSVSLTTTLELAIDLHISLCPEVLHT